MSVLSFPRLYFQGFMSWDPNVTNNRDLLWDPNTVDIALPPGVTIDEYEQWVLDHASGVGDWNIFGSHDCNFVQFKKLTTTITGGDAGKGRVTSDPVTGQPLSIPGKLVDLDPRNANTSQVFFDRFSVGADPTPIVTAPRSQRMHSRFLNFARNLNTNKDPRIQLAGIGGVVWQTAFPTASLRIRAKGSPLLTAFTSKLKTKGVKGLM